MQPRLRKQQWGTELTIDTGDYFLAVLILQVRWLMRKPPSIDCVYPKVDMLCGKAAPLRLPPLMAA